MNRHQAIELPEREPPHCPSCHCGSECPECARLRELVEKFKEAEDREQARADAAEAECARLREDNNSLRRFQDEAIRRCARDRCSMRARRIAELESEVEGLEKERDREKARADALQKIVDGCPEPGWSIWPLADYYRDHILPAKSKGEGK